MSDRFQIGDYVQVKTPDSLKDLEAFGSEFAKGQVIEYWPTVPAYDVDVLGSDGKSYGKRQFYKSAVFPHESGGFTVGQRVQIKQNEDTFVSGLADKAGVVQEIGTDTFSGQVRVLLDELRRGKEQTIWLSQREVEDEMKAAAALHDAPDSIGAAVAALESGGLVKVPDGVDPESGLTDDEAKVTEALSKFWGAYIALPEQHPNEIQEAFSHVNALQNLIAIRAARAAFPQMWPTIDVEGERRREVLGRNLKRKGRG